MTSLEHRHDIVFLFDVANDAANAALDNSNLPALAHERNPSFISNLAIKRAICRYTENKSPGPNFRTLVRDEQRSGSDGADALDRDVTQHMISAARAPRRPPTLDEHRPLIQFLCRQFFDVRAFGATLGEGPHILQLRGPVQITFASSVDPVVPLDNPTKDRFRTYGLYRMHLFISPNLASKTGFGQADLDHLLTALAGMFELTNGKGKGRITSRRIIIFRHESGLGCAPAQTLFDRVRIERENIVPPEPEIGSPARRFEDYDIAVHASDLPAGIEMKDLRCERLEDAQRTVRSNLEVLPLRQRLGMTSGSIQRPA